MLRRDLLEAVEPERVDEAKRPELAASVRALARLSLAEAEQRETDDYREPDPSETRRTSERRAEAHRGATR